MLPVLSHTIYDVLTLLYVVRMSVQGSCREPHAHLLHELVGTAESGRGDALLAAGGQGQPKVRLS